MVVAELTNYLVGVNGEFGYGSAPDVSAPGGLTPTPGDGRVSLKWIGPQPLSTVTDYRVEYRIGAGAWTLFADAVSTALSATVTGLVNGTTYGFRVAAIRAGVLGNFSPEVLATPAAGAVVATTLFGFNTNQSDSPLSERLGWFEGRAPCVRRYYGDVLPATFEQTTAICPERRLSISFKDGGGFTAAQIAAGGFNARFKQWLESIPAGWTVYVTYYHESNDDIINFLTNRNPNKPKLDPAHFVGAYAQLYPVIQEATLRAGVVVKLCANFMAFQMTATTSTTWNDAWVPPPGTMDLCTIDLYGNPGQNTSQVTGPGYGTSYPDPVVRSAAMFAMLKRTGWEQHWGILEVNAPARDWDGDESARAAWHVAILNYWLGRTYPPEICLLWEAPSGVNWDQSYGRVSGDPLTVANAVKPYITSVPDGSP